MATSISERRRAERLPASGRVEISFEDPTLVTVDAELLETSATGFRIAHDSKELISGLNVVLHRESVTSRARVIWTHLLNGRRVSGCVAL
jgi:hypothetical protein